MTISCLKDLLSAGSLHYGDILLFGDVEYEVRQWYFSHPTMHNDFIFKLLKIDKYKVGKTIYGYEPVNGNVCDTFPEYRSNDFNAAYRMAIALFILYKRLCNIKEPLSVEYGLSQLKSDVDRYCNIGINANTAKAENRTCKSFVRLNESLINLKIVL